MIARAVQFKRGIERVGNKVSEWSEAAIKEYEYWSYNDSYEAILGYGESSVLISSYYWGMSLTWQHKETRTAGGAQFVWFLLYGDQRNPKLDLCVPKNSFSCSPLCTTPRNI